MIKLNTRALSADYYIEPIRERVKNLTPANIGNALSQDANIIAGGALYLIDDKLDSKNPEHQNIKTKLGQGISGADLEGEFGEQLSRIAQQTNNNKIKLAHLIVKVTRDPGNVDLQVQFKELSQTVNREERAKTNLGTLFFRDRRTEHLISETSLFISQFKEFGSDAQLQFRQKQNTDDMKDHRDRAAALYKTIAGNEIPTPLTMNSVTTEINPNAQLALAMFALMNELIRGDSKNQETVQTRVADVIRPFDITCKNALKIQRELNEETRACYTLTQGLGPIIEDMAKISPTSESNSNNNNNSNTRNKPF